MRAGLEQDAARVGHDGVVVDDLDDDPLDALGGVVAAQFVVTGHRAVDRFGRAFEPTVGRQHRTAEAVVDGVGDHPDQTAGLVGRLRAGPDDVAEVVVGRFALQAVGADRSDHPPGVVVHRFASGDDVADGGDDAAKGDPVGVVLDVDVQVGVTGREADAAVEVVLGAAAADIAGLALDVAAGAGDHPSGSVVHRATDRPDLRAGFVERLPSRLDLLAAGVEGVAGDQPVVVD